MKKALAILLTFILTFSCFSILGITVLAETSLLEPGFDNWYYNAGSLNSKDENGDGVNDYVRITSTTKKSNVAVATAPFELIPENEYELSFYIRIPDGSNSFLVDGAFKAPEVIIYEPTVSADTGKATTVGTVSATQTSNNYYAYRYNNKTDTSLSWSRRLDFSAEWTVDGYEALTVTRYSNFAPSSQKTLFGETADVKEIYANWTKITAKFTALADEDGETSQTTAVCFNVKDIGKLDGYMLDIKDVTLVNKTAEATEPEEPDEPEPEPEPEAMDFEDATKWGLNGYKSTQLAGYDGHVTPEEYMSVEENTAAMTEAAENVHTASITYAVRDTTYEDREIHQGDIMGMIDNKLSVLGNEIHQVGLDVTALMVHDDATLITIYYGCDVAEKDAQTLCDALADTYPDCDVEIQYGGQPLYYYLIAVE